MDWRQFEKLIQNLKGLGGQRIAALGILGALVIAIIALGSYYASRSGVETLYVGLSQQDVSRMGAALAEAGISFEASADGTKLGVPFGQAPQARALLAEKGLPGSPNAGYELFDKLGALGLTSFMQEVTRVRALEGELARTILNIKGIRAARVHLVLPDGGSLRTRKQLPAASVVIRTDVPGDATSASAIKHLVGAALPEMTPEQVTVIGTDGTVLSGGSDLSTEASTKLVELERNMARQIQDNVRRTLSPYLGVEQFSVSATVRLNADKRQTNETTFDPEKRVERSTRVVKETQSSQDGTGGGVVSAEQNIPDESSASKSKDQNKRAQDRKEETANYEIGSKSTTTTSDGYRIEGLSLAIVVNKRRLVELFGKELSDEELKEEVSRIEQLAQSAIGFDAKRGDRISIAAVNFVPDAAMSEAEGGSAWTFMLLSLAGVLIKSMTVLAVAAIVVWVGFKPAIRTLLTGAPGNDGVAALEGPAGPVSNGMPALETSEMASPLAEQGANPFGRDMPSESGSVYGRRQIDIPQERLGKIIEMDEAKATEVLRDWVRNG